MRESSTYQLIVEEGLAKGLAEGQTKGRREDILKLATKRFGEPTIEIRDALSGMKDIAQLDSLMDRLLDASSWDDLMRPRRARKRKV